MRKKVFLNIPKLFTLLIFSTIPLSFGDSDYFSSICHYLFAPQITTSSILIPFDADSFKNCLSQGRMGIS